MLFKNIILTSCIIAFTVNTAVSKQVQPDITEREHQQKTLTIAEENFECFQSLQCLKRENPFKNSNLDEIRLNNSKSERFVVEGSSKNETMYAVYNSRGDLIKATALQRNIALPGAITSVLATGEFKSWKMIGNERVIENFDKDRIQYKVILQNGDEVRVEHFDKYGQFQNRIL